MPAKAKSSKKKTPVVKKTLNPHYDHTFVYKEMSLEQLRTMSLELTVWDKEAMGSNDFLGGVRLSTGTGRAQTRPPADWMRRRTHHPTHQQYAHVKYIVDN